ncbi:MAG: copper amine oxidase N-terminal domain-containing protein [Syntrophomonadaceae bacterium]|nr:copper amine oxidase N-terminal domain-containing protein [Syntrophomonadaceae bacterium]
MSSKEVAIWVYNNNAAPAFDTRMLVYFGQLAGNDPAIHGVKVSSSAPAGEAKLKVLNVNGLFPPGEVTIGNVVGSGAAQVSVLDTKTITEGGTTAIEFTVQEGTIGGVKKGTTKALTFKLPKGFEWDSASIKNLTTGDENAALAALGLTVGLSTDKRSIELNRVGVGSPVVLDTLPRSLFKITANVKVDETTASYGDVNVTVTGKNTVTPNSVLIGTFSDYGYEVVVEKEAAILSGRTGDDAAIEFTIKENVKGSLLNGRTVYMTLPDGVEWTTDTTPALTDFTPSTKDGSLDLESCDIVKNKPNVVKATIKNDPASRGTVKVEANIKVAANYTGDIDVEFSGSAGIDETVTVAEAIAPLSGEVDVVDVIIGSQDQKSADIVITENEAEALMSTVTAPDKAELLLTLPAGASWSKLPNITVDNGLDIGTPTRRTIDGTTNKQLVIPVRGQSDEAANITISDVYLTLDRTVPEGDLKVSVGGPAIDAAKIDNRTTALSLVIANVVTPAPGETVGSCEFKIGSNIYYAGGVAKVMDVAPYIKGDRTYVPMRYMGETLGAEVVWDDAARTVTLTKGDTTVVFTIGSTSYTVNGEAKTADVAPEIANDRTMLPARFVAEAFGAVVGWDASSQTVLIQK